MPYVYILECADGSYYTGSTWHMERRLAEHQHGEGARYTARRLPVKLVFCEYFQRIDEAYQREKQVQGWSRAKKLALIESNFEELTALPRNYMQFGNVTTSPGLSSPELVEGEVSTGSTTDAASTGSADGSAPVA